MALSRNLFRVSAVVPEQSLHSLLLLLANAKAMNVETFPVTPDNLQTHADQPSRSGPGKPGRPGIVRSTILTRLGSGGEMNLDALRAAMPNVKAASIDQAVYVLKKEGHITRVGAGTYKLAAPAAPRSGNGHAAPALQRSKTGSRMKASEFVLSLFTQAPDKAIRRQDVIDAIGAAGGKSSSVTGVIDRLIRDKKIHRVSAGVYQLKS